MAPLLARLGLGRSGFGFGKNSGGSVPFSATGGTKTFSGSYTIHTFTTPGSETFTVSAGQNNVEIVAIGGGGGGGGGDCGPPDFPNAGGNSGSSGGISKGTFTFSPGNYTVYIGGRGDAAGGLNTGTNNSGSGFRNNGGGTTGNAGESGNSGNGGGGGGFSGVSQPPNPGAIFYVVAGGGDAEGTFVE